MDGNVINCFLARAKIINLLLKNGANIALTENDGHTAIQVAIKNGKF